MDKIRTIQEVIMAILPTEDLKYTVTYTVTHARTLTDGQSCIVELQFKQSRITDALVFLSI